MAKSGNTEIGAEIGRRIRRYRKAIGLTQTELGKRVNVTFQQIQKYEKATNRIAIERLIEISRALRVPLQMLIPTETASLTQPALKLSVSETELKSRLLSAFHRIPDAELKNTVITLAECLAE